MITLIRHGQAGSRQIYDTLSELGREQARVLGEWFAGRGVRFDAVITGGLERQIITAREIFASLGGPEPVIDRRWGEFDLDEVYAGVAPHLCLEDEQFRIEYKELQRDMADPESAAHRTWRRCDVTVVRAWIEGRFAFAGESWLDFQMRVRDAFLSLPRTGDVAVVTSATPIALSVSAALGLEPAKVMQLAGAQRNTAFTQMGLRRVDDGGEPHLVSFNNVPHLAEPRLATLR